MGGIGHRLHAAGHRDGGLAAPDDPSRVDDRGQARQADLVDGGGGHIPAHPGTDRCLRGGTLPEASLQDVPHDDEVDIAHVDPRSFEGTLDRDRPKLDCGQRPQAALEPPVGCAGGAYDDDVRGEFLTGYG